MNYELNILCIYRAAEYSPNMEDKDAIILNKVSEQLRDGGHHVSMVHEENVTSADLHGKDLVLSMARRQATLDLLRHHKAKVINTPQSVAIAARRTLVFDSDSSDNFPLWVKKADGYSQRREDVVYVEDERELQDAVARFQDRGIDHLFYSHHIEGDLIKFYGVQGTDFFSWNYYTGGFSKFGWEEKNDKVYHYLFSEDELKSMAAALAETTGLQVYGGDCIVSEDGVVHVIDFNDWPSFGPCQDDAAKAIASLAVGSTDGQPQTVASTYKSQDTEEWLDVVFTRKVGFRFAQLFQRLDWHPNTVTVISMCLGVIAGFFFYNRADTPQGLMMNAIGVLLMMIANFLDSADGQLARMTGKMTQLGRILDGSSADIMFICIYICLACRLMDQTMPLLGCQWGVWAFLMAAFSGLMCHGRHCGLADYYRNIHLFFIKEKSFDEFDTYDSQHRLYLSRTWREAPVWKFFMWFYVRWTRSQEAQTPHFQLLINHVRQTGITPEFRAEFRRRSLPMMKWTNILTFNTRAIALYVGCLTDRPWLYLLFEIIVLNSIYWHMRLTHERFCREMADAELSSPQNTDESPR